MDKFPGISHKIIESDPNGPRDGDREKRDRHINKAGDTIQGRSKF